ncbi:unnamed protein product [Schistosoma mattheei]|uniref:Uncharacterized protein n=1 Tax=Schistosoma mattheei TaxID=31246 RepID=A0A183NM93_9TREM|nr:unnamed protein product [Schistosoma mattheei]
MLLFVIDKFLFEFSKCVEVDIVMNEFVIHVCARCKFCFKSDISR